MSDRIVYEVVTTGGGVDGMDHNDKGGTVVAAYYDKAAATDYVGKDGRYRINPTVVDVSEVRKQILARLTPVERLILDPDNKGQTRR